VYTVRIMYCTYTVKYKIKLKYSSLLESYMQHTFERWGGGVENPKPLFRMVGAPLAVISSGPVRNLVNTWHNRTQVKTDLYTFQ
jgi:hypothetical protein